MPAKKIRGKVSAVLSDLVNQMESGTDSAMGIQIHRNSRLKVLAPPSHTTCLPCRQISMPPRMAMRTRAARTNGRTAAAGGTTRRGRRAARLRGGKRISSLDFIDGCTVHPAGWIVPHHSGLSCNESQRVRLVGGFFSRTFDEDAVPDGKAEQRPYRTAMPATLLLCTQQLADLGWVEPGTDPVRFRQDFEQRL